MLSKLKAETKNIVKTFGYDLVRSDNPVQAFHSEHYLRHNARRLEHLASLRLPLVGSVLEVGAGIGDHSHFYLDRGCSVTITEVRSQNLAHLRARYPHCRVQPLDMEAPTPVAGAPFDVVHCYGLLYHLSRPQQALEFLNQHAQHLLLLETCVSFGDDLAIHPTVEPAADFTQAASGTGCRPTRPWLFAELQRLFAHVYIPKTQPCHEEFPLDWTAPEAHPAPLQRAIFIASRQPLDNELLTPALIDHQTR